MLKLNIRKYIFIIALCIGYFTYSSTAFANNFEKGKSAYLSHAWNLAVYELRPLADEGHAEAQLLMANMYSDGVGVKKNDKKARELYELSAHKGNNNAMLALATIYSDGVDVPKDKKKGAYWFTKSSEWGNQVAQFTLASMLINGEKESDIPVDKLTAYKWFLIAINIDDVKRITKAAKGLAELTEEGLTPAQIEQIKKEVRFWRPKEGAIEK